MSEYANGDVSPESVREHVRRIVASPHLRNSRTLVKFFQYIVEQQLEGRAAQIKESVLGVEVFDRRDFDPRHSSIVRVSANNLRKKLRMYYANEGRSDDIAIELPEGSYVPIFVVKTGNAEPPCDREVASELPCNGQGQPLRAVIAERRKPPVVVMIACGGVICLLTVLLIFKLGSKPQNETLNYIFIRADREFSMGCSAEDTECSPDEKPPHKVVITRDYYITKTEVTVGAYRRFAKATGRIMPEPKQVSQTEDHPVVNVSWEDAAAYCKWDGGGHLPTEAQWEYAARAGASKAQYGPLDEIAWHRKTSLNTTHIVGKKRKNSFGLQDVLGNVWEWCADWYEERYYERSPREDPAGPSAGSRRSIRGGSWYTEPSRMRLSVRGRRPQQDRDDVIGFRCVREIG